MAKMLELHAYRDMSSIQLSGLHAYMNPVLILPDAVTIDLITTDPVLDAVPTPI